MPPGSSNSGPLKRAEAMSMAWVMPTAVAALARIACLTASEVPLPKGSSAVATVVPKPAAVITPVLTEGI
ncbi:hypothetical protein D3C80_2060450 [compost metagenome]